MRVGAAGRGFLFALIGPSTVALGPD